MLFDPCLFLLPQLVSLLVELLERGLLIETFLTDYTFRTLADERFEQPADLVLLLSLGVESFCFFDFLDLRQVSSEKLTDDLGFGLLAG